MKYVKGLLLIGLCLVLSVQGQAQKASADDMGRILLTPWVPQQIEGVPASSRKMLSNRLNQVALKNGVGGGFEGGRFIITANVVVMTKDILPGPPPMHAITLDVTLYIGDGIDGKSFSSHNVSVKGVGRNETKAYNAAFKNIQTSDPNIASFVESGKKKIVEYYNTRCDFIIKEAQTLEAQNKYDEAIYVLTSVPEVSKECYTKAMDAVGPIYNKFMEQDCKQKVAEAQGIWNAAQDMAAAEKAGPILASIDPEAKCAKEARTLSNKIAAKVKQIDGREWKYKVREQQQESERIKAMRDVGVAYGNGQPKTIQYKSIW